MKISNSDLKTLKRKWKMIDTKAKANLLIDSSRLYPTSKPNSELLSLTLRQKTEFIDSG